MAIIQEVKDGEIVDYKASKKEKKAGNEMGQDQFLQLLVAQMQYQDPLEPTSNTEWVAQMATFSMVESLNNMQSAMTEQSANSLVGQYVLIKDGDGYVKGKVDYVTKQNGNTVVSVDDKLYTLDKLDTVADEEYYKGSVIANELHQMIQLLPSEENLTTADEGLVKSARETYDEMSDSQKGFVEKEDLAKLSALEEKMDALKATQFTGMVRQLPSVKEIEEADEETLAGYTEKITAAREYYDNMSKKQQSKLAEGTLNTLQAREEAAEKAAGAFKKPEEGDGNETDDVSAILQKILEELRGSKQETETDKEDENQA